MAKKRIAIIGVGVIGIPVMTEILNKLSKDFSITVYSFISINGSNVPDIKIRCLPQFPIHQKLKYIALGLLFVLDNFASPYHVIHAQSAFPGGVMARWLGKVFNIPWMVTLIGGEVEEMPEVPFGDLLNPKLKLLTQKVCREASILTVMSRFHANSVKNFLGGDRSIEVLPYAPKSKEWYDKQIGLPVRLLHIAYHHPVKNHAMLLATVRDLVEKIPLELTIIGANYDETFVKQVKNLGLEPFIKIEGPKAYDEIGPYYVNAHILLHTSWYEGLPTVAFEAMAYGTVVCGTRVGIISDFDGNLCLAVNAGDSSALAEAVHFLVSHPKEYQMMRKKAHEWAASNDINYYAKKMTGLYNHLM
jgi:glycosyltransferase involved in cell wall biosynthesis